MSTLASYHIHTYCASSVISGSSQHCLKMRVICRRSSAGSMELAAFPAKSAILHGCRGRLCGSEASSKSCSLALVTLTGIRPRAFLSILQTQVLISCKETLREVCGHHEFTNTNKWRLQRP